MISVIIPVYNTEKYISIAINSVLMQSYQNFEIICIDDCSTDSSLEILQDFANKDERITVLQNEKNSGSGLSRNKGLDLAKGKYVFFLDSDDWIDLSTFELSREICEKNNLDLLIFKSINYDEDNNNFYHTNYYDMKNMDKYEGKIFSIYNLDVHDPFTIPVTPYNKLYRRELIEKFNIRYTTKNLIQQDNPFYWGVITKANRVSVLNKYFVNRRRREGSVMTLTGKRLYDNLTIVELILNVFLNDSRAYNHFKKEVLNLLFRILRLKHQQIDEEYKDDFYEKSLEVINKFRFKYNLEEDIKNNLNNGLLKYFNL